VASKPQIVGFGRAFLEQKRSVVIKRFRGDKKYGAPICSAIRRRARFPRGTGKKYTSIELPDPKWKDILLYFQHVTDWFDFT
jgi:hypothetical protein